jgi:hypothetical protein
MLCGSDRGYERMETPQYDVKVCVLQRLRLRRNSDYPCWRWNTPVSIACIVTEYGRWMLSGACRVTPFEVWPVSSKLHLLDIGTIIVCVKRALYTGIAFVKLDTFDIGTL